MQKKVALMFKAIGDPNRLKILNLLSSGQTCGCTLIDELEITQPTLSYHLDILTKAGLTTVYKEGTWKKHHINQVNFQLLIDYLNTFKESDAVSIK